MKSTHIQTQGATGDITGLIRDLLADQLESYEQRKAEALASRKPTDIAPAASPLKVSWGSQYDQEVAAQ